MTVTKDDALTALHDVEAAGRRSRTLFRYWLASPYLLLWGALWIVAGAVGAASPANTGIGWAAIDAVGLVGTGYLVATQARRYGKGDGRASVARWLGTVAVLAAFIGLTLMVFAPVSGAEVQMLITLLLAAAYAIAGCWLGLRYAVVGVALAGVALGVFYIAPAQLPLVLPFIGGGALVVGGLWMRRA